MAIVPVLKLLDKHTLHLLIAYPLHVSRLIARVRWTAAEKKVLRTVVREEDGLWYCWLTVDAWNFRLGCEVESLGLHVSLFCVWGPRVLWRDQSARYFSDNWRA